MTTLYTEVNYKSLIGFSVINADKVRCLFINAFTGKEFEKIVNISPFQIKDWLNGQSIQQAFSNISPDEREYFLTGASNEEWEQLFGEAI